MGFNKIACSLNNTAAIGENGEIYVWGSGKYGLTCSIDTESRVNFPKILKIPMIFSLIGNPLEHKYPEKEPVL